jgi:hypothetical protein
MIRRVPSGFPATISAKEELMRTGAGLAVKTAGVSRLTIKTRAIKIWMGFCNFVIIMPPKGLFGVIWSTTPSIVD